MPVLISARDSPRATTVTGPPEPEEWRCGEFFETMDRMGGILLGRGAWPSVGALVAALVACGTDTSEGGIGASGVGGASSSTGGGSSASGGSAGGGGALGPSGVGGSGGTSGTAGATGGGGAVGVGGSGAGPAAACAPLPPASGSVTVVQPSQADMLPTILQNAAANATIALADGTYAVGASLWITKPGITLRSISGMRDAVVIDGSYTVDEIVDVNASNVTIADLSIKRAVHHPIHVVGGDSADTDGVIIHNVHVIDGGQQLVKVNANAGHFVDQGTLECSLLEMTDAGRPHIEANFGGCYTGGLDVHEARGWIVRMNTIEGIYCTNGSLAEHAIHVWTGSRDTLVERNVIVNCARGIGFGLGQTMTSGWRTYPDNPYPGLVDIGHFGGIIRNNMVFASIAEFDTGIGLEQSRGTRVYHNTVVQPPSAFSSIDVRFANTDADVENNLMRNLTQRDGATPKSASNLQTGSTALFVNANATSLDLHLVAGATQAIDQGAVLTEGGTDIDGAPHAKGPPDIGADEFGAP